MKCENCDAFFVRYPCPSCGIEDPRSSGSSTNSAGEETLIRPSDLKGGSAVNPDFNTDGDDETESSEVDNPRQIDDSYLVEQRGSTLSNATSDVGTQVQERIQRLQSKEQVKGRIQQLQSHEKIEESPVMAQQPLKEIRDDLKKLLAKVEHLIE